MQFSLKKKIRVIDNESSLISITLAERGRVATSNVNGRQKDALSISGSSQQRKYEEKFKVDQRAL